MSLKSALFALNEAIIHQQIEGSEEKFIQKLEAQNSLKPGSLVTYFNHLMMLNLKNAGKREQTFEESKKINRKWTKNEIDFMFQYITERQDEGVLNITEILDEIAQLLNRGYQSVNYKYYSLVKVKETKRAAKKAAYHFTTINETEVPVISTEVIPEIKPEFQVKQAAPVNDMDLLDILSGLITNVQQLPGINLHELLGSLYQLTNLALQNQEAVRQLADMESEVKQERELLQEKLMKKEQQLMSEKKRNDELQIEVAKLAKEINAFNQLGDSAKIQNLKSYNQRLNYIIDRSGVVLQVGS